MIRTLLTKAPTDAPLSDVEGMVVTHPSISDASMFLTTMRQYGYDGVVVRYDRGHLLERVAEFLQKNYAPNTLTEREWKGEAELLINLIERELVAT